MSMALRVTPISQDWSDVELVAAVRRGNDTAFEELYSRYGRRICSYVHGMVGDHGRSEDITQEIFIAAHRRMRATDRPIAFKAWIYEIAKNACIDSYRRTRRAQEISLDADEDLTSADRGRLTAVTTLDAALDTKQSLHDLRGAFGGLSDSHHEILVLREFEGRSYSDIAERLGMSLPVVESTLFRARRRLAEEYDELASGRRCEFVRKLVDSGPQYSLGIRDRRRMARHFAHCQPCRAHARLAGFEESILTMPRVRRRIAALLPIPLLRARWGAGRVSGAPHGRSSALALRSLHTVARSADQILGATQGVGRGTATAAAIVLAGVGGGIATVTYQPAKPLHRSGMDAASGASTRAAVPARTAAHVFRAPSDRRAISARSIRVAPLSAAKAQATAGASGARSATGGAGHATGVGAAGVGNAVIAGAGAGGAGIPISVRLASPGAPQSVGAASAGNAGASGVGATLDPIAAAPGGAGAPTVSGAAADTGASALPTATPQLPAAPAQLPAAPAPTVATGSTGSGATATAGSLLPPIENTVHGVAGALGGGMAGPGAR